MSLKIFHLVFIAASALLVFYMSSWAFHQAGTGYFLAGIGCFLLGILLVLYFFYVSRKLNRLHPDL